MMFQDLLDELRQPKFPKLTSKNISDKSQESIHLGVNHAMFTSHIGLTKATLEFPELWKMLQEIGHYYDFPFSSATINKNFGSKAHQDKFNIGNTLIFTLGDF